MFSKSYILYRVINCALLAFSIGCAEGSWAFCSPDFAFYLQPNSPAIDAGTYVTTVTTASGSGTTLQVGSPGFFQVGKRLKTEGKQVGVVAAIDTATKTITLESSISWVKDEGVHWMYYGEAPDIGACEFIPEGDLTPPGNVRVEDLVDVTNDMAIELREQEVETSEAYQTVLSRTDICREDTSNVLGCVLNSHVLVANIKQEAAVIDLFKTSESFAAMTREAVRLLKELAKEI